MDKELHRMLIELYTSTANNNEFLEQLISDFRDQHEVPELISVKYYLARASELLRMLVALDEEGGDAVSK